MGISHSALAQTAVEIRHRVKATLVIIHLTIVMIVSAVVQVFLVVRNEYGLAEVIRADLATNVAAAAAAASRRSVARRTELPLKN